MTVPQAKHTYDVVVVGARAAGAATAMLLARQGLQVLLVDRGRYGADTLSTHALMRGSVYLLSQWGLLDRIIDAGTPPVRHARFDYGTDSVTVALKPTLGVEALYAPRRTVLDPLLVTAAEVVGTTVRFGITVTGLLHDSRGRVVGIRGHDRNRATVEARARLVVGADGVKSIVAREVRAATLRVGTSASAVIYGYWSQLPVDGYEWFYRTGHSAGIIPTNQGQACIFAAIPALDLTIASRRNLDDTYHRLLAAATSGCAERLAKANAPSRLHTWLGRPGYIRQAHGPGWALAGDAGSFLDPLSTHGITDALRDAAMLARSIDDAPEIDDTTTALSRFTHDRNQAVTPIFDIVDRIAAYRWTPAELKLRLHELSAAMNTEAELIAAAGIRRPAS
jgi:flavin-dependent dehydrogenase